MATDPYLTAQRGETRALVQGLEGALRAGAIADAGCVQDVLERIGDVIRLGELSPAALLQWIAQQERRAIADAIVRAAAEADAWTLPDSGSEVMEDEGFGFTLRRRDEVQSFVVGLTRAAIARNESLSSYEAFAALEVTLAGFDESLAAVCSRLQAEAFLGSRLALQTDAGWFAQLRDEVADVEPDADGGSVVLPVNEAPSVRDLEAYVATGALLRYVEGFAARDAAFSDELSELISALLQLGEQVGFSARRFLQRQQRAQSGTQIADTSYRFAGDRRLAAATEPVVVEQVRRDLGRLPDLQAVAQLIATGDRIELEVFADEPLARISLGDEVTMQPVQEADGVWTWSLAVTLVPGVHALRVTVRAPDGRGLDDTLHIELT
jgi:hypothetical protein